MKHQRPSPTRARRFWVALLWALCSSEVAATEASAGATAGTPAPQQETLITFGENSAESTLPAPTRYVIFTNKVKQVQTLHRRGDVLFHPEHPSRAVSIERIDAAAVLLKERPKNQTRLVRAGRPIPGFPELIVKGIVVLEKVQYRSRVVEHLTHTDPVLLALEGSRAIVAVEVLGSAPVASSATPPSVTPSPAGPSRPAVTSNASLPDSTPRHKLDPALFADVPVTVLDANTYEVDATAVKPAIDNMGQVLSDLQPMIAPAFSLHAGLTFNLTSAVVDGTLSGSGFTVTNSKIAQHFGIEVATSSSGSMAMRSTAPLTLGWPTRNSSSETRLSPNCAWTSGARAS